MFSHVILGANDIDASRKFYDAALGTLGVGDSVQDPKGRIFYRTKTGVFGITLPIDGEPATHGNGFTLGFAASSPEEVDAWHEAGLEAGGTDCEDPPGVREGGGAQMYIAYLRDPAGNKICALHRM